MRFVPHTTCCRRSLCANAAAAWLGWVLGSTAPTVVTKATFMFEVMRVHLAAVRPQCVTASEAASGLVVLHLEVDGLREGAQARRPIKDQLCARLPSP